MVKIRLQRFGKNVYPVYRIVAVDSRKKRNSDALAYIGTYEAHSEKVTFDLELYQKYLVCGAQPTEIVAKLWSRYTKAKS